jgi:hypothetical protein
MMRTKDAILQEFAVEQARLAELERTRRSPILLTERKDHLEYFAEHLRGFVRHLIVLNPRPAGAEWIEAYRSWAVGG